MTDAGMLQTDAGMVHADPAQTDAGMFQTDAGMLHADLALEHLEAGDPKQVDLVLEVRAAVSR
jgi:hypothetical protein